MKNFGVTQIRSADQEGHPNGLMPSLLPSKSLVRSSLWNSVPTYLQLLKTPGHQQQGSRAELLALLGVVLVQRSVVERVYPGCIVIRDQVRKLRP